MTTESELNDSLDRIGRTALKIKMDRDRLLEALKVAVKFMEHVQSEHDPFDMPYNEIQQAQEAIRRAEGE